MEPQQKPSRVLVVTHPLREDVAELAEKLAAALRAAGVEVKICSGATRSLMRRDALVVGGESNGETADLVLALGGDGTVLRAAKVAAEADVPLLGVNFGKVGFLAEAETGELETVVSRLLDGEYTVEERTALSVEAMGSDGEDHLSWAFNDIAVEKAEPARMLELYIEIDGTRISRYGSDGVVVASPTGSTAHAMSAGGPVVWPDVDALVVVPMNAHALFAKPMVVHSSSVIRIGVESTSTEGALVADGKELTRLTSGATVTIRRSARPVRLVRMSGQPFASRLVSKLSLPVDGWRHGRVLGPAGRAQPVWARSICPLAALSAFPIQHRYREGLPSCERPNGLGPSLARARPAGPTRSSADCRTDRLGFEACWRSFASRIWA